MNQYTSSIIKKYGDSENVPKDVKTIFEIFDRQGSSILLDCLAEKVGASSIKYNWSQDEREKIIQSLVGELLNALQERL